MSISLEVAPQPNRTFKMKTNHSILLAVIAFAGLQPQAKAQAIILGDAAPFAVLAVTGITNVGTTTITGDIGSPIANAGSGTFNFVTAGTDHGNDTFTQNALTDMGTAYAAAAARTVDFSVVPELGGVTLTLPGVYASNAATFGIGSGLTLTLNGMGDPNAVFIFKMTATLITAASSQVALINGARAENVFWQVGSSATLSGTNFSGSILAAASITLTSGAMVDGRLLALAHVTLNANTISVPTAIPEPATNALIGGLAALGLVFWRRRRAG